MISPFVTVWGQLIGVVFDWGVNTGFELFSRGLRSFIIYIKHFVCTHYFLPSAWLYGSFPTEGARADIWGRKLFSNDRVAFTLKNSLITRYAFDEVQSLSRHRGGQSVRAVYRVAVLPRVARDVTNELWRENCWRTLFNNKLWILKRRYRFLTIRNTFEYVRLKCSCIHYIYLF